MITRVDPSKFDDVSVVQVDSDAGNPWLALNEIEDWAAQNGFVRTSEYSPRQVLIEGHRRFRGICFRISNEERAAIDQSLDRMVDRGKALSGVVSRGDAGG